MKPSLFLNRSAVDGFRCSLTGPCLLNFKQRWEDNREMEWLYKRILTNIHHILDLLSGVIALTQNTGKKTAVIRISKELMYCFALMFPVVYLLNNEP